ncbi:hypothetical protein BCR36DRAFT_51186 [Piromyces finnis]|uniref:Coth-domain-containing protein n=1 Tax=Piromyces finnis TaxID=1754191 RepID=A0A1Y1VNA7_9FUNG|nr:hypothetical protein BCR36DRAFT_51186 [Piromyces finnis]|eukprot:ORX60112.1 hypothetical protein BCR36DRAFT_51186 [Piromyces finnis]
MITKIGNINNDKNKNNTIVNDEHQKQNINIIDNDNNLLNDTSVEERNQIENVSVNIESNLNHNNETFSEENQLIDDKNTEENEVVDSIENENEKIEDNNDEEDDEEDKSKINSTHKKVSKNSIKEFFEKTKDTVIDIYITMPESDYNNMTETAQCVDYRQAQKFSTRNADAHIEFNNEIIYLSQVELSLGGASSRSFQKVSYNIKTLNNDETVYGMKKFKLRGDDRDPTHMVSRLSADFVKSVGLIATSVSYSRLYINDQYMGLYTFQDVVKKNWINNYFEDKDTKNCYKCETIGFNFESFKNSKYPVTCSNINDDYADYTDPFDEFVQRVNESETIEELEEIMDVDVLLKYIAFEWIVLSWDHMLIYGHNFYWYLRPDGKWIPIYFDFDLTWYISNRVNAVNKTLDKQKKEKFPDDDHVFWPNMSIKDWEPGHKIINILIHKDDTRFRSIVQEMVKNYYNPTFLNKKIDHLHDILKEYVIEDLMFIKDLKQKLSFKVISEEVIQDSVIPETKMGKLESINIYNNIEDKLDSLDANSVKKSPLIKRVDGIAGTNLEMKQRGRINLYGLDFEWKYKNYYEVIFGEKYIINPRGSSRSSPLKWTIQKRFDYLCHTFGINVETLELITPRPKRRTWSSTNKYALEAYYDDNNLVRFDYPNLEKEDFRTNYCKYCEIYKENEDNILGKENNEICIIHPVECGLQKGQEKEVEMGPNGYPYCNGCDVVDIKGGVLLGKENDTTCEILTDNCE